MELSTQIKEARAKLGLSQSQAAKAWEVPVQTLQKWEQGVQSPRGLALKTLRQILDAALSADKPASASLAFPAAAESANTPLPSPKAKTPRQPRKPKSAPPSAPTAAAPLPPNETPAAVQPWMPQPPPGR